MDVLKKTMQKLADQLAQAYNNFKKDSESRHNQPYREKRMKELEDIFNKFKEAKEALKGDHDQQVVTDFETIHSKYKKRLLAIPDDRRMDDPPEPPALKVQRSRIDELNNIFDQIQGKIGTGEVVSSVWCKVKIDRIKNYFEKFSLTHDEIAHEQLPESYLQTKIDMGEHRSNTEAWTP